VPLEVQGVNPEDVQIALVGENGEIVGKVDVVELPDGSVVANVTPDKPGQHALVTSLKNGSPVLGDKMVPVTVSPALVKVSPESVELPVYVSSLGDSCSLPLTISPEVDSPTNLGVDVRDEEGTYI
jgi:hypothetical protein